MSFRDESMEEINLRGAGIDTQALQKVWERNPDNFSMSFSYGSTAVYIDKTHIVLTDDSINSEIQTAEKPKAGSD